MLVSCPPDLAPGKVVEHLCSTPPTLVGGSLDSVNRNLDFVRNKIKEGALFEEIMEEYTKVFYLERVSEEQQKAAFLLNAQIMISNIMKEFKK